MKQCKLSLSSTTCIVIIVVVIITAIVIIVIVTIVVTIAIVHTVYSTQSQYMRINYVDMQLRASRDDLNVYLSHSELLGVVIPPKQSIHQERGWNTYLCLNELLSSRGLNLFPLPIGIYRDPSRLSVTFAYECIHSSEIVRFNSIVSPTLATFLRKHPIIVRTWCMQLCSAYQALLHCNTGSLMKPINILTDVFVKDSGLLLIGNVCFDSTLPRSKPKYRQELLSMICRLLSTALCVSRSVMISLQYLR